MQGKVRHHTAFFATDGDTDMKTSRFQQSRKLIPSSNNLSTNTRVIDKNKFARFHGSWCILDPAVWSFLCTICSLLY